MLRLWSSAEDHRPISCAPRFARGGWVYFGSQGGQPRFANLTSDLRDGATSFALPFGSSTIVQAASLAIAAITQSAITALSTPSAAGNFVTDRPTAASFTTVQSAPAFTNADVGAMGGGSAAPPSSLPSLIDFWNHLPEAWHSIREWLLEDLSPRGTDAADALSKLLPLPSMWKSVTNAFNHTMESGQLDKNLAPPTESDGGTNQYPKSSSADPDHHEFPAGQSMIDTSSAAPESTLDSNSDDVSQPNADAA